jgi:DUF971 family protein
VSDPTRTTPRDLAIFPTGELAIVWGDGHESYYDPFTLRCACPCAQCVDEMTGEKVLRDSSVPPSVRIESVEPVGRYAITIRWSDGHGTGIYIFEKLRSGCPCPQCTSGLS